jgi:hypothetical protein
MAPSSAQLSRVSTAPGIPSSGTGWAPAIPLSSPAHVAACDRLMDAQDQKDRQELIMQKAKEQAALKLAEGKS